MPTGCRLVIDEKAHEPGLKCDGSLLLVSWLIVLKKLMVGCPATKGERSHFKELEGCCIELYDLSFTIAGNDAIRERLKETYISLWQHNLLVCFFCIHRFLHRECPGLHTPDSYQSLFLLSAQSLCPIPGIRNKRRREETKVKGSGHASVQVHYLCSRPYCCKQQQATHYSTSGAGWACP